MVGIGGAAPAQLHQGVGFLGPGREDAARAMVFEAAPDQMNAVRQQRRGQGVAAEAPVRPAIEGEGEGAGAVDAAAGGQAMGLVAHDSSPGSGGASSMW